MTTHDPNRSIAGPIRRAWITVEGPDAARFLQGQCSQDVDALAVGTSTWSFVLQPQGKVDAWVRLTKTAADRFVLDTDGDGDALVERLRRYLIRTKAEISTEIRDGVAVRGTGERVDLPDGVVRLPAPDPAQVTDGAAGEAGYDLFGEQASAGVPSGVVHVDGAEIERHRIERGVPAHGTELGPDTIPAEVGQWIIDTSVSFTKGCYTGQELVARIDSRGNNVPRRLRVLSVFAGDGAVAGLDRGAAVRADGPAASLTSVAATPDGGAVALAFLGRAVDDGDDVTVDGPAGPLVARVHAPPLDRT